MINCISESSISYSHENELILYSSMYLYVVEHAEHPYPQILNSSVSIFALAYSSKSNEYLIQGSVIHAAYSTYHLTLD
jgi:hypothetical protein